MQTDAVVNELNRIGDIQMVMGIAAAILALFALAIAAAALFTVIKVRNAMVRGLDILPEKTDPMIAAATRIAENARDVSDTVKVRVSDLLDNLEDISARLKNGADAVEDRVKRFGVVVDVVQDKTENLMLDAASAAHGVQTAADAMRRRQPRVRRDDADLDEDVFDE